MVMLAAAALADLSSVKRTAFAPAASSRCRRPIVAPVAPEAADQLDCCALKPELRTCQWPWPSLASRR